MSWMDSWSRPSANSKVPAPLYLSNNEVPYCHTCGRVMTTKKSPKRPQEIKYCSDRCRSRKPGERDRDIEKKIAALLNNEAESGIETTASSERVVKGDPRMIVTVDEIEAVIFGSRFDPEKIYGRKKNRKSRYLREEKEWRSVDMESSSESESGLLVYNQPSTASSEDCGDSVPFQISHVRPPQIESEINFSAGGGERSKAEKIEETSEDLIKRREGAQRAEEREMVRRAARRAIVFGIQVPKQNTTISSKQAVKDKSKKTRKNMQSDEEEEPSQASRIEVKKAEALMNGLVVEPSFAKGNWSIRWRE